MKCPVCATARVYKKHYLNRDGWWCPCCYDWCRPVAAPADASLKITGHRLSDRLIEAAQADDDTSAEVRSRSGM